LAWPGVPEFAEGAEAVGVVGDGEEAPCRLPRRQDLRQPVQRLQPKRVRLQCNATKHAFTIVAVTISSWETHKMLAGRQACASFAYLSDEGFEGGELADGEGHGGHEVGHVGVGEEQRRRVGGDGLRDGAVHRLELVVQRRLRVPRPLLHAADAHRLLLRQGLRVPGRYLRGDAYCMVNSLISSNYSF